MQDSETIEQLGIDVHSLARRAFPELRGGKEFDRLLKGRFFQGLLPNWQCKLGLKLSFVCKSPSHWARDCPKSQRREATGRGKPASTTSMIAPMPLQELEQLTDEQLEDILAKQKLEREQELLSEAAHMDMIHDEEGSSGAVGTQTRSRSNRKYKKQEGARRQAIAYSVKVEILKINLNPDRTTCMYSHIVYLYLWLAYRLLIPYI